MSFRPNLFVALAALANLAGLSGCLGDVGVPPPEEEVTTPADPTEDPNASGALPPPAAGCKAEALPARIWRLSDEQYRAAVADLLPGVDVPAITTPGRSRAEFINVAELYPVSGALAVDLRSAAKTVAAAAVRDLPARTGCAGGDRGCLERYAERLVSRAQRRPLEASERDAYARVFAFGAEKSPADGLRLVIEAVLQAPSFLYRTELGAPGKGGALAPFELASALSFFFLDSIPDDGLWRAAEDGSLTRADGYQREVTRLLALPRVRDNLARVFLKWLGLGAGVTTELPSEEFPAYDEALRTALAEESTRFFRDALERGGTLSDLFTSRRSFVDSRLAMLYGVSARGADFAEVALPAGERAGMLTLGAFLVSKSRGEMVVHRGKWVREELLCGVIPQPPPDVAAEPMGAGGTLTGRQEAELRMSTGKCAACHQLMDNLGLAFERYDALSRYRARDERGAAIDGAGAIKHSDVDGAVDGAVALAERLGGSRRARLCIEARMLAYAFGRDGEGDGEIDRCEVSSIDAAIGGGNGRLLDLMGSIARLPAFKRRTGGD